MNTERLIGDPLMLAVPLAGAASVMRKGREEERNEEKRVGPSLGIYVRRECL